MADATRKAAGNAEGRYYVDETCTPCNLCVDEAPDLMRMSDGEDYAFFARQPTNEAEEAQAVAALEICPTEAIGDDG